MINEIFATLKDIVIDFGSALSNVFSSAIKILFGDNMDTLTPVGMLLLLGLGTGLLIWGFKFIRKLIRVRTK